jgi:hypothetical protein
MSVSSVSSVYKNSPDISHIGIILCDLSIYRSVLHYEVWLLLVSMCQNCQLIWIPHLSVMLISSFMTSPCVSQFIIIISLCDFSISELSMVSPCISNVRFINLIIWTLLNWQRIWLCSITKFLSHIKLKILIYVPYLV